MKQTASSSFPSIKSSQAYNTSRRQMIPSPLPLNGIALLAVSPPPSPHNGRQLSVQHKHRIIMVCTICFSRCVCMPSFLDCPTPPFSVSLHPASFSTCAGCMPGLQTRLYVFPALATCHASPPGSLPRRPGNLTTVCPSPLPSRSPKGQQTYPGPARNTLKVPDQHLSGKGEALSVYKALGRRWRQPLHNAISHLAASGHKIKRGIHCRCLKSFR